MSGVRSGLRRVGRVLAWSAILGTAAILVVAVLVPRIGGATPYTVLTGSMRPELPPGTLVVVKPVAAADIAVGDVITYQLESGERTVVTHRVVAIAFDGKGERTLRSQGDANNVADRAPVQPVQVRGELWYSVPYLGYLNNAMTGRERQWAVYGVATLLLGYAAIMFLGSLRGRRRHPPRREAVDEQLVTPARP